MSLKTLVHLVVTDHAGMHAGPLVVDSLIGKAAVGTAACRGCTLTNRASRDDVPTTVINLLGPSLPGSTRRFLIPVPPDIRIDSFLVDTDVAGTMEYAARRSQ